MKALDLAIVGSGMGGSLIAALNKKKNITVFERDKNLGGCASTFKRFGHYYNAGATTFVGYEENHPVKRIFDKAGFIPDIQKSDIAIRILQNSKVLDRKKDMNHFLESLNTVHYHKNNTLFWSKLKKIDEKFWSLKKVHFNKYSVSAYKNTTNFIFELFSIFAWDLFKSANSFIKHYLPNISKEYLDFIDAQLLITIQTTSKDLPLLSLALGLCYPFHDVFYVNGGMGSLFDGLLKDINVKNKETILKIIKEKDFFRLISSNGEYLSKKVVLNSTIYDSCSLFHDKKIIDYYKSFEFSDQSAFVINMTIKSEESFLHHYQIILDKKIKNCISNSFFVSFSSSKDIKLSKNGTYSITISTHTKSSIWDNLSIEKYEKKKKEIEYIIVERFLDSFDNISKKDIVFQFSASSKTFKRYINRNNCAGHAMKFNNIFNTASSNTPFKNLYNIGDTVFAGQGWPGVALGVEVLDKELNG